MRRIALFALLFCGLAAAQGPAADAPSPHDLREARKLFNRGVKLKTSNKAADALELFTRAAELDSRNPEYVASREVTRQQLVYEHIQSGSAHLAAGNRVGALASFRAALSIDPQNAFALQRMKDALGEFVPARERRITSGPFSPEVQLQPKQEKHAYDFRGDSRQLFEQIGRDFGFTLLFDDSFASKRVRFTIEAVDFATAMQLAGRVSHAGWIPAAETQVLLFADTPDNRRTFERNSVRTFYVEPATTADLNDFVNALRNIFEFRFVVPQPATGSIVVRGQRDLLEAAADLLNSMDSRRPQVLLDVKVFQVSETMLRDFGVELPLQFQIFHLGTAALLLQQPNIQDLVNQLIASGGINQASSSALQGLIAQLQNQQSSIFQQPFATFGGGTMLTGIGVPPAKLHFSQNSSLVTSLEHMTLRAAHGDPATFRLGSRFPILNASFAPIFNSPALSRVIANQSFQAPFPSFSYEDLGMNLKATPRVYGSEQVGLDIEVELKSLAGQSLNGVPILTNRYYKGSVLLKQGEPIILAGSVSEHEQRTLHGVPGFGELPGLRAALSEEIKEKVHDELLIIITPHILLPGRNPSDSPTIALPANSSAPR